MPNVCESSKNNWCIGAFFSDGTVYKDIVVNTLVKSLDNIPQLLGKTLHINATKNYGNWRRNVAEKPKAILDILTNRVPQNDCLVFLDADATIEQYPALFDTIPAEYDIAYHVLDWNVYYGYRSVPATTELLTGTMWFRNTPMIRRLCTEWYEEAKNLVKVEQVVLADIIERYNVNVFKLPLNYCYIDTRTNGMKANVLQDKEIVIKHHQASRTYKKVVL